MESLSDALRAKHSRNGKDNRAVSIDKALAALSARKVPEIDGYLLSPVSSLPSKIADLLQLGIRRSIDLTESAIREMNRESLNSSCMLARGVLETACLLVDLAIKARKAVQAPDAADLVALNTFVANMLLGSGPKAKTFYFIEGHTVQNIISIIERVDKELPKVFSQEGVEAEKFVLGGSYEGLSEHAHPNAHGMALTYATRHGACVTTFTDANQQRVDVSLSLAISALSTSLEMEVLALDFWDNDRVEFSVLAERKLHEAGTWPAHIPYPIPRRSDGSLPTAIRNGSSDTPTE